MEIYQLRTFLTVARLAHLTRAAERLNLTQPAVSKQIKALEGELGVALFERTSSGMSLTKSGQLLLPQAEKTLVDALELINMAKKMRGEIAGTVRLGTIIDPEFLRLGSILGQLLQFYPMVDIKLMHGISGWVLEQVKNGTVDAGFYLGEQFGIGIGAIELCTLTYLVVAPPAWADKVRQAGWREIAHLPWIGTPPHSSQHRLVNEMFREQGFVLSTVVEADQESSMRSLVAMGVGLCLLRDDIALAAQEKGELVIWDKTQRRCALSFIFQERRIGDGLLLALKKVVDEVWTVGPDAQPPMRDA